MTSSFSSSSPSSLSLLAAGCDLAGGAKSEERASERRGERRGSARERESFSFCLPPRPSTSFAAFCVVAFMQHSFLSVGCITACTGLSRQHRPGRGLLSAFGCYLRNFWRAIALYFLSAQSQAGHCGWFLAVSGCCFPLLPPSLLPATTSAKALAVRAAGVTGRRRRDRRSRPRPRAALPPRWRRAVGEPTVERAMRWRRRRWRRCGPGGEEEDTDAAAGTKVHKDEDEDVK